MINKEEIKKIRRKFYFKGIEEYLKELEQKDSQTKQEKKRKNVIPRNCKRLKSI